MTRILAGLDMDRGAQIESILDPISVKNLADFVLANFISGIHKETHSVPIYGDLFSFRAFQPGELSINTKSKIKLNTAPVIGRILISNLRDEASLKLFADLTTELKQNESAILHIESLGRLSLERAEVYKKYEGIFSSFDLDDVLLETELQPDNQVKLITSFEYQHNQE